MVAWSARATAFIFCRFRGVFRKQEIEVHSGDRRSLKRRRRVADEHGLEAGLVEAASDFAEQGFSVHAPSIPARTAEAAALCSRTSGEDYVFAPSTMLVPKLSCSGITLVTRNPVSA